MSDPSHPRGAGWPSSSSIGDSGTHHQINCNQTRHRWIRGKSGDCNRHVIDHEKQNRVNQIEHKCAFPTMASALAAQLLKNKLSSHQVLLQMLLIFFVLLNSCVFQLTVSIRVRNLYMQERGSSQRDGSARFLLLLEWKRTASTQISMSSLGV